MNDLIYERVFERDGTYWIRETTPDGTSRRIEEYQLDYTRWLAAGGVPDDVPYVPPSLESVKAAKISEIQSASDAAMAQVEEGYTQGEIKSFDRQRAGALDILAGLTTTEDAQYVAALAAARVQSGDSECTAAWLAQRIKDNADMAAAYTIQILGKQQGLEARVRAASTIADVEAVVW